MNLSIHNSCRVFLYAIEANTPSVSPSLSLCILSVLQLPASELIGVPNQIIVQYKDPSFLKLAIQKTSNQESSSESTPYKYTAILPGRIDLVLIEGENINQLLEELKKDPTVEYVEPHYVKQVYGISFQRSDLPNDSYFNRQWSLNNSSSEPGSDIDFLKRLPYREKAIDNPVIIGIIDSTFAIEHPDLINQLWVNEEEIPNNGVDDDNNGYIDDIHGFDLSPNFDPNVQGDDDHEAMKRVSPLRKTIIKKGISGAFPNVKFIALACSTGGADISSLATF